MFSFVNIPARLLTLLELNITPGQVAGGVCLGMFLGFAPLNGPAAWLLLVFFFLFKVNRLSTAVTLPLFKLFYALGVASMADKIGGYLLIDAKALAGFWSFITGLPILALLDLNNTIVAGGLALSVALCLPVYFLARFVYNTYIEKKIRTIQTSAFAMRLMKYKFVNNMVKKMELIRSKTE